MTPELVVLAGSCGLGLIHILLASHSASMQRGYRWAAGARDVPQPLLTGVAGRLERASANFRETFPIFLAAVLATHVAGVHDWRTVSGAWLYLGARLIYLPLYAAGIFLLRPMAWNVAMLGIVLLIWAALKP